MYGYFKLSLYYAFMLRSSSFWDPRNSKAISLTVPNHRAPCIKQVSEDGLRQAPKKAQEEHHPMPKTCTLNSCAAAPVFHQQNANMWTNIPRLVNDVSMIHEKMFVSLFLLFVGCFPNNDPFEVWKLVDWWHKETNTPAGWDHKPTQAPFNKLMLADFTWQLKYSTTEMCISGKLTGTHKKNTKDVTNIKPCWTGNLFDLSLHLLRHVLCSETTFRL